MAVDWEALMRSLGMLNSAMAQFDPTGGKARELGVSVEDYQRILQEAQKRTEVGENLVNSQREAYLRATELANRQQSLSNEQNEALARFQSGGMQPGETRSNYRGLPLGAAPPARPVERDVTDTREDRIASYMGGQERLKIAQEVIDNQLEAARVENTVNRNELEERKFGLSQERHGLNEKYIDSVMKKNAAEVDRIRQLISRGDSDGKLTPEQALRMAQTMTNDLYRLYDEDEVSMSQRMDTLAQYRDALMELSGGSLEDAVTGEGGVGVGTGAFEDEQELGDEEQASEDLAYQNRAAFQAKKAQAALDEAGSQLQAARVGSMSTAEKAADPSVPLPQVLNVGPEAQKQELEADSQRLEAQVRQLLSQGVDISQWPDDVLAFVSEIYKRGNQ